MKLKSKIFALLLLSNVLMGTSVNSMSKTIKDDFCKVHEGIKVCMKLQGSYTFAVSEDNKTVEKTINTVIDKLLKTNLTAKEHVTQIIKQNITEKFKETNEEKFFLHLLSITPKSFSLKIRHFYQESNITRVSSKVLNYDVLTGKEIKLEELFLKNYQEKLETYAEKVYRIQNRLSPKQSSDLVAFKNNKFFLPKSIGIGRNGLHLEYDFNKTEPIISSSYSLVLDYKFLEEIINPKGYLSYFLKEKKTALKIPKYYKFIDRFGIIEVAVVQLSKTRIQMSAYLQNKQALQGGGLLSISFPNLLIDRASMSSISGDFYPKDRHLYSIRNFEKEGNIVKSYSLLEANIKQWKRYDESKQIGFSFDIPENMKTLELDVYADFILQKTSKAFRMPFSSDKENLNSHKITIDLQ